MNHKILKEELEKHYLTFDKRLLSPDPLEFPHNFTNPIEIELAGFIASIFAYGNVNSIMKTLNKFLKISENKLLKYIVNTDKSKMQTDLKSIKHRFYSNEDIFSLFLLLQNIFRDSTLQKYFRNCYSESNSIKETIQNFHLLLINNLKTITEITPGIKFMFPLPENGSACKRINLFLRWMVRKDRLGLDFGLWDFISPKDLIIPVDVHIAKISKEIGLTERKNVSWQMAEEITQSLRIFDNMDPVKYDFAICHIGIRKIQNGFISSN